MRLNDLCALYFLGTYAYTSQNFKTLNNCILNAYEIQSERRCCIQFRFQHGAYILLNVFYVSIGFCFDVQCYFLWTIYIRT